ncbi:hypothetical protein STAS_04780 [Striga asiatica]|uniref:Uncharacterized protein n=1 Tax=Striga asiatica TaxID=4170 RepID=A0A5A7P8R3_STRAF|nr:hypothetical protein STAS_04780 [Striga asiatica]
MGFEAGDLHGPISTPKLTLTKLPYRRPRRPPPIQTPPLLPSLSVPFRWEEAPGKPRSASPPPPSKCLDLPPRLLPAHGDANMTDMPSPTTVLDGPYVGRSLSLACTFSFRRGPRPGTRSRRWGSFGWERKWCERGNMDISRSLGEFFRSERNAKMARGRKRRSFFSFSRATSNLWVSTESFFVFF